MKDFIGIFIFVILFVAPYVLAFAIAISGKTLKKKHDKDVFIKNIADNFSSKEYNPSTLISALQSKATAIPPELATVTIRIVETAKRIAASDDPYLKELKSSTSTYYLPTAIKLIDQYQSQTNDSTSTESINLMIAEGFQQIAEALEAGEQRCKQKRALQEMYDLWAEVAVLESKSRMDGLI